MIRNGQNMLMTKKEKKEWCGVAVASLGLAIVLILTKADLFGAAVAVMAVTMALLAGIDQSPVLITIAIITALSVAAAVFK
jgi:cell division protein FtsW (lipid II flippase)